MTLSRAIADTGMGMTSEVQARLFTAFEQADGSTSRRFGGTGLGLSISQRLAQMMGGSISVDSSEGRGSTFTLRLPCALGDSVIPETADRVDPAEAARAGLKILVAEDNPANQRIIDLFLRPIDADLTIVGNGQLALEALSIKAFDLVLMDMQMPVMDGLEATRQLRASGGPNAALPVLALTANVMEVHRKACSDAGMTGHISKPIDARLLIASIFSAVDAAAPRASTQAKSIAG